MLQLAIISDRSEDSLPVSAPNEELAIEAPPAEADPANDIFKHTFVDVPETGAESAKSEQ